LGYHDVIHVKCELKSFLEFFRKDIGKDCLNYSNLKNLQLRFYNILHIRDRDTEIVNHFFISWIANCVWIDIWKWHQIFSPHCIMFPNFFYRSLKQDIHRSLKYWNFQRMFINNDNQRGTKKAPQNAQGHGTHLDLFVKSKLQLYKVKKSSR